jgi:hypothetical protein
MPSPPITIGELTDVPAYDSPIASPWAQEVTRRTAHRFASTGERDAKYPANTAGAGAICAVVGVLYVSDGAVWAPVQSFPAASWYADRPRGTTPNWPTIAGWDSIVWPAPSSAVGVTVSADSRSVTITNAGLYHFGLHVNANGNIDIASLIALDINGAPWWHQSGTPTGPGFWYVSTSAVERVAAGAVFTPLLYNSVGQNTAAFTCRVRVDRIGA